MDEEKKRTFCNTFNFTLEGIPEADVFMDMFHIGWSHYLDGFLVGYLNRVVDEKGGTPYACSVGKVEIGEINYTGSMNGCSARVVIRTQIHFMSEAEIDLKQSALGLVNRAAALFQQGYLDNFGEMLEAPNAEDSDDDL